ncbi:MAG: hypothetical protein M1828_002917 [Chrysothrix sp. TS-e1954]|nr:MAG: hypothetical protein M1828_002917 [Chrysothrix sp. TS-e1954]
MESKTITDPEAGAQSHLKTDNGSEQTSSKPTPPRSIFSDLDSAYRSITRQSRLRPDESKAARAEMPLPPVPAVTRNPRENPSIPEVEPQQLALDPKGNSKGSEPSFFRKRLSAVLGNLGRSDSEQLNAHRPSKSVESEIPILARGQHTPEIDIYELEEVTSPDAHEYVMNENKSGLERAATSEPAHHHFDQDQVPLSRAALSFPRSHRSIEPGRHTTENLIDLYRDDEQDVTANSPTLERSIRIAKRNMRQLSGVTSGNDTGDGSTIDGILDQYARSHDNSATTSRVWSHGEMTQQESRKGAASTSMQSHERKLASRQALSGPPGEPPSKPLPSDPSSLLMGPTALSQRNRDLHKSSTEPSSQPTRYTNTQDLLQTSSELSEAHMQRSEAEAIVCHGPELLHAPLPHRVSRASSVNNLEGSFEDTKDPKYHSKISYVSNGSGSFYYYSESDGDQLKDSDLSKVQALQINKPTFTLPAFQRSSVQPGYSRLSISQQEILSDDIRSVTPLPKPTLANKGEGDVSEQADNTQDWETLDDVQTAPDWESLPSLDHISDDSNPFNTFSEIHEGKGEFDHKYREKSTGLATSPVLFPSYHFEKDNGFPHRNALADPASSYKHPLPLSSSHSNPFRRNPPALTLQQKRTSEAGTSSNGSQSKPKFNLSIVHDEPKGPSSPPGSKSGNKIREKPSRKMSLIEALREEDPRMASTPLSAGNSFAQTSQLGKKLNVTGTPGGTDMRHAGSSVVGSSPMPFSSSPPFSVSSPGTACWTPSPWSPITPQTTSSVMFPGTQLSSIEQERRAWQPTDKIGYRRLTDLERQRSKSIESDQINERLALSKIGLDSHTRKLSDAAAAAERRRATVKSQTKLRHLHLPHTSTFSDLLHDTRLPRVPRAVASRPKAYDGARSLAEADQLFRYPAYNAVPRLRHHVRAPSSVAEDTQDLKWSLSRKYFLLCFLFIPSLLLYGFGAMDSLMSWETQGRIGHFDRHHKTLAKLWGIGILSVIISGLSVFFIVIRTVPNSLPR